MSADPHSGLLPSSAVANAAGVDCVTLRVRKRRHGLSEPVRTELATVCVPRGHRADAVTLGADPTLAPRHLGERLPA